MTFRKNIIKNTIHNICEIVLLKYKLPYNCIVSKKRLNNYIKNVNTHLKLLACNVKVYKSSTLLEYIDFIGCEDDNNNKYQIHNITIEYGFNNKRYVYVESINFQTDMLTLSKRDKEYKERNSERKNYLKEVNQFLKTDENVEN